MTVRPTRAVRPALAALIPAALLAGCGLIGGSTPPAAPPTAAGTTSTPSTSAGAASASASAAPADLPVLAQATTSAQDIPLRVAVNRLRAQGQLLQLTFSVTNTGTPPDAKSWQVAQFFADGIGEPGLTDSTADAFSVDGVYLLDPKNAKRYLVARGGTKLCVCTGNTSSLNIAPGTTVAFDATFKAPPDDVTSLTVVIPKTPAFANVPVQR